MSRQNIRWQITYYLCYYYFFCELLFFFLGQVIQVNERKMLTALKQACATRLGALEKMKMEWLLKYGSIGNFMK